jgi:hypothetical protein
MCNGSIYGLELGGASRNPTVSRQGGFAPVTLRVLPAALGG